MFFFAGKLINFGLRFLSQFSSLPQVESLGFSLYILPGSVKKSNNPFNSLSTTYNGGSMKVTTVFSLVVCLVMCFVWAQSVWAQTADVTANTYKVPIYLSDLPGDTGILSIGVHPNASYSIDGPLGFSSGDTVRELEIPPPGPTNFDVRLVSIASKDSIGTGSFASIHPLRTYVTQNEKWKITFQPESDSGNTHPMKLWWPANIGSVGGGYWHLTDALGNLLCDMAAQSSFTMPNSNPGTQSVFVVEGDSLGFLTAVYDSLVYTYDNKGKIDKPSGVKPYNSEATFTVQVPALPHPQYHSLHLEFNQGILEFESVNPRPDFWPSLSDDGKTKVTMMNWPYLDTTLQPGLNVTFQVLGAKGVPIVLKKYWWTQDTLKEKPTKLIGPAATSGRLLLYSPNWVNVVEEVYSQGSGTLGGNGIVLGITTPTAFKNSKGAAITRYVYNPKYKDLYSTLYNNSIARSHDGGTASTLYSPVNGKPVVKALKTYSPKLGQNPLVGELATLKFNIAMSALSTKTNAGFGGLFYSDTSAGSIFDGLTVNQIATYADSVFSGADTSTRILTADLGKLVTALHTINGVFSGKFDTISWSASKVRLKSPRLLMDLNPQTLYRKTNSGVAPLVDPNWLFKGYEPEQFKLEQNYPNPFNPTTTIQFTMPADGFVTMKVYNILGQEVATLYNHEPMAEGVAQAHFNASNLASGVYFYRFVAETSSNGNQVRQTFTQVKKMMLVK